MATSATFMGATSATRGRSEHTAADYTAAERFETRTQADPCLLRGLPGDGVYFYSKKVDNSRIVRQADPEARGECWSAVAAAGVVMMLGASIIAPHVGSVLAGYKLEALKTERQSLIDQKRDLEVKEAGLLRPERLHDLARLRSLATPGSEQVIHLDMQAVEGSFASMQAPAGAHSQQSTAQHQAKNR